MGPTWAKLVPQIHQNLTLELCSIPLGPPRAPYRGPQGAHRGPQGAQNVIRDVCWSPKGSQNEAENLPKTKQQTRLFLGMCLDRFGITKCNQHVSFLDAKIAPNTALDEFRCGKGR